jgi:hypothetical protein
MQESITEAELQAPSHESKAKKTSEGPRTMSELIAILTEENVPRLSALRSKAAVLSEMLRKPADEITIGDIQFAKPGLRAYLKSRRLAENSVQAYISEVSCLLKHAVRLGWKQDAEVPAAWQRVLERCIEAKCDDLCRYIVRTKKNPQLVKQEDLDEWIAERVKLGGTWSTARRKSTKFWKVLLSAGVVKELPASLKDGFGVPLADFPDSLRTEIESLLSWKTASVARGRPKRGKIRQESAGNLQRSFSELYGYATRVSGVVGIGSVVELVTPEIVYQYVDWALNTRKVRGQSVHSRLVIILAVLSHYPQYTQVDTSWFKELVDEIPRDNETELREKQAAKQVPYELVEAIPEKIRTQAKKTARLSEKNAAIMVRDELLMTWLTVLPWRQRNLRECRVGGTSPNLFKGPISPWVPLAKPDWVLRELELNPQAEFWQCKFAAHETKVGKPVHLLLPRPLIPLLEQYLSSHHGKLTNDEPSDFLFPTKSGTMLTRARMTITVGELTLRYLGKRVTPHTFRHIVAYAWLRAHPDDYLTLSKILFHTNINTTLRCYGARFNESNGACGMEKWVESRKKAA